MKTEMERDLEAALDDTQLDGAADSIENDILAASGEEEAPIEETTPDEKPDDKTDDSDTSETDDKPEEKPADDDKTDDSDDVAKTDKAPAGWTPANREHWAGLPDGLKQQIAKREKEVNTVLQNTSQERKLASSFLQTAAPFQAIMAAEGTNDPVAAFKGLMQTAATLKMGSASQKAQKISDLIGHYGVDISELDTILSGQTPAAANQNSDVEQMIANRLKPFEDVISGYQQKEQASLQAKNTQTTTEVEAFGAANEFFSDVRMMMADAIDMAKAQGRSMTLKEAYDFSCNMSPEIKSVLDTRAGQTNLAAKKAAASSLNHKMGGSGGKELPQGLEAQIAAAWDGAVS